MPDYYPEKDAPKVRRAWEETVDPEDESVEEVAGASYRMVGGSPSLPPRTNRVEPATVSEVNLEDLLDEEFVNSPPDEREGLSAGSDNDSLFSFLRATRLQEAQEFRRKGYNSQVPEVDSRLVTQLREAVAMARSRISLHATVGGPLGSLWLLDQIDKIERLTGILSDDDIKSWLKDELPGRSSGEAEEEEEEVELGSRRTAQSLARQLESTLQTLIRVVHTLCAIDAHSTPKKRGELLVTELASAFSSSDESSVKQALERMTSEVSGDTAWTSLMQARAAGWETDKAAAISTMIETTRHEAEKANKKARALPGYSASQAFFSGVATYLQSLSGELKKASGNASQSTSSPVMPYVNNDKAVAPLSPSDSFPQRFIAGVGKKKSQAQIALAGGQGKLHQLGRIIRHGDLTKTPSKNTERVVADSAIRSILWQWQQTAIKIQYASGAILSKVKELKKIEEMFSSDAVTYDKGGQQEGQDTSVSHPGEDDLVAQVRQWVNDSIEQTKPENQQAEKLAVLNKLLDGDIDNARALIGRLREKAESMQSLLRQQRYAVLKMIIQRSGLAPSLRAVDELLPDVAKDLTASLAALENACQAAAMRDFAEAEKQADYAQLRATKVKESLSAKSARLTERPLDEHSRGSRLAKHWANLAKEQNQHNDQPPDAERVLSSLKKQGLLEGVLSTGDPEGYLFATRLAGELENARNDELRLPMSPEQYAALEKGLVEYIVKWGQKRVSRGIARIIIELSFEQGLDAVSFSVSSLFRIPFKVLKASIKIPYNVNKINDYIMPGHDKPYKAFYGLLEKKLKQLGFNLLTAPVPGTIKLGAGAGITAVAALYNLHVGSGENTFSAVYERLTEGKKSKKIKMQSAGEMLLDTVIDTTTAAASKGTSIARKSGKSENNVIPDDAFVKEHVGAILAQLDEMKAEEDSSVWVNAAESEREAEPVSDSMPLRLQTEVEPFSAENDQASRQPHVRRTRAVPSAPSTRGRASREYRIINDDINSEVLNARLSDDVIIKNIQERANQDPVVRSFLAKGEYAKAKAVLDLKIVEYLSFLTQRYSLRRADKYRDLLNEIWNRLSESREQSPEIKTLLDGMIREFLPERSIPQPLTPQQEDVTEQQEEVKQTTDAVNALKSIETMNAPIMNMNQFIDDHIKTAIEQYNRDPKKCDPNGRFYGCEWTPVNAQRFPELTPDTQIRVDFASRGTPGKDDSDRDTYWFPFREVITGEFLYKFKSAKSSRFKQDYFEFFINNEHEGIVNWIRKQYGLEQKLIDAVSAYRDNADHRAAMTTFYQNKMQLRCVQYLARPDVQVYEQLYGEESQESMFRQAVTDFVEGRVQAQEVFFDGVKLNGAFMIPVRGNKGGVILHVDKPVYFYVKVENRVASYITQYQYQYPETETFKRFVLESMPVYHSAQYIQDSPDTLFRTRIRIVTDSTLGSKGPKVVNNRFSFSASSSQEDMAGRLFTGLMERMQSDADAVILTHDEYTKEQWLEIGKVLTMYASVMLAVASMGTAGPLAAAALTVTQLGLDVAYVMATLEQMKNADRADAAANFRIEAITAGVLAGIGNAVGGAALGRQVAKPTARALVSAYKGLKVSANRLTSRAMGQIAWQKLANPQKIDLVTRGMLKTPTSQALVREVGEVAVRQAIRTNLELDEAGASRIAAWGGGATEEASLLRLLEADMARLDEANATMRNYLEQPPLMPYKKANRETAAYWILKPEDEKGRLSRPLLDKVNELLETTSQRTNSNQLLQIDTIEAIHRDLTALLPPVEHSSSRVSGTAAGMGSDIGKAGFTRILDDIATRHASKEVNLGEALFVAVMQYKPFAHDNELLARTLYMLVEMNKGGGRLNVLNMELEAMLLDRIAAPVEGTGAIHELGRGEDIVILDDLAHKTSQFPDGARPFNLGGMPLQGRRQGQLFEISFDKGQTWQKSDSKILQTAWSLQNAGGKNKGWHSTVLPRGVSHPRHDPIPGNFGQSLYGENSPAAAAREDLTEAGEWPGAVGTMPDSDQAFFAHVAQRDGNVEMDDINFELLKAIREKESYVAAKTFELQGHPVLGRVEGGIFKISKVGEDSWQEGTVLEEFAYRMQTTQRLPFGFNYFSELREPNPLTRVTSVAGKVAQDNRTMFAQASKTVKDPLALYGAGESWESVLKLEKKSGLMTQAEYEQVKLTIRSNSKAFVGGGARILTSASDLTTIPAGYRIALLDNEGNELVHGMISGGNGIAYGARNYVIGGESFWSEINLADTFESMDGRFYVRPGKASIGRRPYKIAVDYYAAPAQHSAARLPARPVVEDVLGTGTIGTVKLRTDGKVEKVFSLPSSEENNPRMVSARNNAEGFNRYYGEGSGEVTREPILGTNPLQYQAKNILRRVAGVSLDNIDDINLFRRIRGDMASANPVEALTSKLKENGIYHNDINAGNIMYDPATGEFNLIDFDSATYTLKNEDGIIQPLSDSQTAAMRSKLNFVLGDSSMNDLMRRKGITSGWHNLSSAQEAVLEREDLGAPSPLLNRAQLEELATERKRYRTQVDALELRKPDDFNRGKLGYETIEIEGVDKDLSELDLTKIFNNPTRSLNAEQQGVMSGLIESARRKRIIESSISVAAKYREPLKSGSTQMIMSPQGFLLTAAGATETGRCSPMVLSLAVALKNKNAKTFFDNLYHAAAQTGASKMIPALDVLHGTSIQAHLTPIKFGAHNEGTVRAIVDTVDGATGTKLFSMDSQNHAMMVGVTVDDQAVKTFHFYDPNIGLSSYSSADDLKKAMLRTVGTKEMGVQYAAYGSGEPKYRLSEINTEALGEVELRLPGSAAGEKQTVRGLSERLIN